MGVSRKALFAAATSIAVIAVLVSAVGATGVSAAGRAGAWEKIADRGLGDERVQILMPVSQYKGRVYFYVPFTQSGTSAIQSGTSTTIPAPVWAYDGIRFRKAARDGFGHAHNEGVYAGVEYAGDYYMGTTNHIDGGELWRTSDGTSWERIGAGVFTDPSNYTCMPLGVQDGRLLIGFSNYDSGCRVWSYDGKSFSRANTDGFGALKAKSISVGATFDGRVHVAAFERDNDKPVVPLVYKGGKTWEATAREGFGDGNNLMCYFVSADATQLTMGTANPVTGGEAWVYNGRRWSQVGRDGMGSSRNNVVITYTHAGKIYASTTRFGEDDGPVGPAKVFRQNADGSFSEWVSDGFGDTGNVMTVVATVYQGYLMAGTVNQTGGQVWRRSLPPADTYYFAEGTTRENQQDGRFDEWLCVQNPNDYGVTATVTYMLGGQDSSRQLTREYPVAANSRLTVDVKSDVGTDKDVSVRVQGSGPIVAERPMYFNYHNKWTGGHVVMGTAYPIKKWYFAEGTTRDNSVDGTFEEWLCIQNPGDEEAAVTFTYMLGDGTTREVEVRIPPNSRHTEDVNADIGSNSDASVLIESSVPVVAERPMYFDYHGKWAGGHDVVGAAAPTLKAYFAEGCTHSWNHEWLCIQNPNAQEANVTLSYQVAGGDDVTEKVRVAPTSRYTVDVVAAVGAGKDVSVALSSDRPVVAERPMYFDYQDKWPGGHNVTGLSEPKKRFYFAEGTTRQNATDGYFDEWLCIQNPGGSTAEVELMFMRADGTKDIHELAVGPSDRATLSVNGLLGPDIDSSVYVESSVPIVVERPMYFLYHNEWPGGSDTIGATY